jgi:hypothetical protein
VTAWPGGRGGAQDAGRGPPKLEPPAFGPVCLRARQRQCHAAGVVAELAANALGVWLEYSQETYAQKP